MPILKRYCTISTHRLYHRQGECIFSVHVQCSKTYGLFPSQGQTVYIYTSKNVCSLKIYIYWCILFGLSTIVFFFFFLDFKQAFSLFKQSVLRITFRWQSKVKAALGDKVCPSLRERRITFSAGKWEPVSVFPSL